ncbi:hypothetical protein KIN20_017246 [Parelaphostrongylus tenuis]|uniref:Uncharacterized protein n=1 Tax=Parelaphostrongylus tenuis TaxID=148309 RepID=A0AAD5MIB6_PARTN|nr:hypothetical protein KIN20_017246 [Parelaphostrongylus tenuis]
MLDALESQGPSTLMPDGVISDISSHLNINITYESMLCQRVLLDLTKDTGGSSQCASTWRIPSGNMKVL